MDESSGMGIAGGLGMFALQMAACNALRIASVQRAGVAEVGGYNGTIFVNQDNLVELIEAEVKKLKPVTDCHGKFAARVFIQVELLGDQDPSVFEVWKAEDGKQEEKDKPEEENNG